MLLSSRHVHFRLAVGKIVHYGLFRIKLFAVLVKIGNLQV